MKANPFILIATTDAWIIRQALSEWLQTNPTSANAPQVHQALQVIDAKLARSTEITASQE